MTTIEGRHRQSVLDLELPPLTFQKGQRGTKAVHFLLDSKLVEQATQKLSRKDRLDRKARNGSTT
jgi:hypothetical protein